MTECSPLHKTVMKVVDLGPYKKAVVVREGKGLVQDLRCRSEACDHKIQIRGCL